jgi:hypothetical protein
MTVCCQNLPLGALSIRSAPSVLVGALFKKFGLFLNTGLYRYLNATVAQSKHFPFGVNNKIGLKNIENASHEDGI